MKFESLQALGQLETHHIHKPINENTIPKVKTNNNYMYINNEYIIICCLRRCI